MKKLITTLLLLSPILTFAQMEIDDMPTDEQAISFRDSIVKSNNPSIQYYSAALDRYQRHLVRQERNTLEVTGGFQGSFTSLNDAWVEAAGGGNSLMIRGIFNLKHIYTQNLFSLTTTASAKIGYYLQDDSNDDGSTNSVWYKDQDEFQVSTAPSFKMTKNWGYGAILKFRSQFADGYVSRTAQESYNLKSSFMAPGYLDLSVGFNYVCPKKNFPIKINLSPVALSATYVTNDSVIENGQHKYTNKNYAYADVYGVSPDRHSNYEGGSSVQIDFDRYFGQKKWLRYTTTFTSFYGWMAQLSDRNTSINDRDRYEAALDEWESDTQSMAMPTLTIKPTVRWENSLIIKATKYVSTVINYELYYNRAQTERVQTQSVLSVGLSYTFKNK